MTETVPGLAAHIGGMNNHMPDFDEGFEKAHGPSLTRELLALQKPAAADLIALSELADTIRESYPEYWVGDTAPRTRAAAVAGMNAALSALPNGRRDYLGKLIRFAVHTEMKHWANTAYVLNPEHDYELLVDPSDYSTEDSLLEAGQDRNQELWANLANVAAFHAAIEAAAVRRAA